MAHRGETELARHVLKQDSEGEKRLAPSLFFIAKAGIRLAPG
jgi:hypothetical protein